MILEAQISVQDSARPTQARSWLSIWTSPGQGDMEVRRANVDARGVDVAIGVWEAGEVCRARLGTW